MATKSKTYLWKGRDKAGKRHKNEIQAANEQLVRAYLRKQGIYATSVIEKPKSIFTIKGRIYNKQIMSFSRQVATMLKAGMPIVKTLSLIADGIQKPINFRELVKQLHHHIETGNSFSEALEQHPKQFDSLYIALVRAGEEAGKLDETMEKIAQTKEKAQRIKNKVKKALVYPSIVIAVAILVTTLLLTIVIPIFESFFSGFNSELPLPTLLVISASHIARDWGLLTSFLILGAIFAILILRQRNHRFHYWLANIGLNLPILGKLFRLSATARFSRTLSVLFESGLPLVKGLQTTAAATGNIVYEKACLQVAENVSYGTQLSFALQNTGLFDNFVIQMIEVGEESGSLETTLNNIANTYEEDLGFRVENFLTLLEPIVIGILSVIVGFLVIAMYMPIFTMGDIIG